MNLCSKFHSKLDNGKLIKSGRKSLEGMERNSRGGGEGGNFENKNANVTKFIPK